MAYLIKELLTAEECKILTTQFDISKKHLPSFDKKEQTGNSYGFRPTHVFNSHINKVKSAILEINSKIDDLRTVNTYVREYKNNDFLKKHIDRPDISTTMSICFESTINKEWPLCVEIDNNIDRFNIEVGDGLLLFDTDKHIHWRDVLICNENERVLQFFLHFVPITYNPKKIKTLL